jgi:hypothetical protein
MNAPLATQPNTGATLGESAATRKKRPEKYPVKFHLSITLAMSDSLQRLSGGTHSIATAAQFGRLALHNFLLANDPVYARQVGANGRHG